MKLAAKKDNAILAVNAGSSSVKAALFQNDLRRNFHYASIGRGEFPDHESAYKKLIADLQGQTIHAVGHRITHGGDARQAARIIDNQERARLQSLVPLAPLHQPHNLLGVAFFAQHLAVSRSLGAALFVPGFDRGFSPENLSSQWNSQRMVNV